MAFTAAAIGNFRSGRYLPRVAFPRPFAGVDSQTRRLRAVLLSATLLGMLSCLPLWLTARGYPLVPIVPGYPQLSAPWDHVFVFATLLSLVAACWAYRPAVIFFLTATLCLYFGDQNRGQPWMYLYWVMLLLTLLPGNSPIAACRVAFSAIYVWAGVQKLNAKFFAVMPAWFAQPAGEWGLPAGVMNLLQAAIAATPFLEIAISIGLWFRGSRTAMIGLVIVLHALSLLFLGPLGHTVNLVVWPWNLAMVALAVVLFGPGRPVEWRMTFSELRRSLTAKVVLVPFCLLPALSFFGKWDSYFSFALYSANLARADVYVSERFRDQLPPDQRRHVKAVKDFDPRLQKPFVFEHLPWGVSRLGVPPISEPRAFAVMFQHVSAAAQDSGDCHMILESRDGRVWLFLPGAGQPTLIGR